MAGVKAEFMKEFTRLNKYIASMTGYSRREADINRRRQGIC